MKNYRASSHRRYDIKYHFVWATKYRKPILTGAVGTRLRDVCRTNEIELLLRERRTSVRSHGFPEPTGFSRLSFSSGDNLSIGAISSMWMDLDEVGSSASLELAYFENGPWGGIEYVLEASRNDTVVGSDSFLISDGGGRDNVATATMSISGVEFDSLHLFARINGGFTNPRAMVDNLTVVSAVPEPGTASFLLLGGVALAWRRRRSK